MGRRKYHGKEHGIIYTPLTKKALKICAEAHAGQVDKSGLPYLLHPVHLAEQMSTEEEICAALLHDTIEDTSLTIDDLRREGFPETVLSAVSLLTHDNKVPYLEYVKEVGHDPIARKVKMADLRHNSDLGRLESVSEKDLKRRDKYLTAIRILKEYGKGGKG